MFKASTVYAAYGRKQPGAAGQDGSNAATGPQSIDPTSSSLPGSLASNAADGSQIQQASTNGVRQQRQHHVLRATNNSNSRAGTALATILSTASASTAGAIVSSTATKPGTLAGTAAPPPGFSLEPRTWIQQAADVTDGLLDASKYKSLAVYAEVRLAEALDKAAQACPNSIAGAAPEDCDDGPLPNPLATAVCCQLLGELADMCGPFQPTLLKLREALLPSIYSCCSGPSLGTNRPLQFDMLPWFALAGRLRRQNNQLLEQQAAFSQELTQHQEHMAQVEQQMQSLQAALEAGTASAAVLQATNATLVAERTAAVAEAAAATEEVKKLTEEVARLSAELDSVQEQLSTVKEEYESEQEQWKAQLDTYLLKLNVEAHERTAAVSVAAVQQQELEQKLWEVERKLEEAEQQLQQQNGGQDQHQLTPRPSDWGPDQQLAEACKSTAETVRQMQQQHTSQLADLQRQLQLLEALAQPDPCPKPWQLNLRAEASKYFLTELDADPTAQGSGDADTGFSAGPPKPKLFAAGLGLGPEVPRFLRWDQPVEVHDIGLQDLEQQVCKLWQAKATYEAAHGQCCLQTFLYEHYRTQALCAAAAADSAQAATAGTPAATAAAAASPDVPISQSGAAVSTEQPAAQPAEAGSSSAQSALATTATSGAAGRTGESSSSGSSGGIGSIGSNSGASVQQANAPSTPLAGCSSQPHTAVTASAAAAGYQLYYASCTHRHDSVAAELLWLVLTGQLPEAMLEEQRQQLQAAVSILQELHGRAVLAGTAESAGTAAPAAGSVGEPDSAVEVGETTGQSESSSSSSSSSRSVGAASAPTGVPWSCLISTMQALFPARSQHHQQELASWLAAACGVPAASSSSGSSSGPHKPEVQVAATTLAALMCALQQELSCRFGSSSVTTTSSSSGDALTGSQAAATAAAAPAGQTAAVRQLTEGLLRQRLMLALHHSQEVGQQVQQLLQAAAAGSPAEGAGVSGAAGGAGALPAADDPVWQQVAQYLQDQGLQTASSTSTASGGSGANALSRVLSCVHAARNAADSSQSTAGACSVVGMLQHSCLFVPPACRPDFRGALMVCTQLTG